MTSRSKSTGKTTRLSKPVRPAKPARDAKRVAVIGAGITGTTTAYQLVKRGFDVTLFDRQPYAAMETSYANGGQLSASNAEVWNSWATVAKGLKWMLKPGAPLLVNPKPSWHKFSWMAEFMANIPNYERNTIATARLAVEAREQLMEVAEAENIDFNCEKRGILHFYTNEKDFEHGRKVTELLKKGGLEREELSAPQVLETEPALTGNFVGGYLTKTDFTGDIHKYTNALAEACKRLGATLAFATDIRDVAADGNGVTIIHRPAEFHGEATTASHFDDVVVCAGVRSRTLAAKFGDRVNIYPVKGYSLTIHLDTEHDRDAAPWVSLLDDHAKIVSSRLGEDRFRVAGTAEFNGYNRDIRASRIDPLISWCHQLFPGMSTRQYEPWAGLRPMLPTMLPKVERGKNPHVFYNTGHGHLGWTLSAATANIIADAVLEGYAGTTHIAGHDVSNPVTGKAA
tara:strand:- start:2180 stop:3547 length:1368 start_codon:yes stop_codon:yes gene_type:complete